LHGILNGVDYSPWDPALDTHIERHYTEKDMIGKAWCKMVLIREMGLDPALAKKPLLAMVSRLDAQKGLDLLLEVLEDLMTRDAGLVVLGSGDDTLQAALQEAATRNPGRLGVKVGFDESLAHRIIAGADIFLIPSRYEPCGLTQMYALKYGTIPVVRATGGLKDTVVDFNPETRQGNGFRFDDYAPDAFLEAIDRALDLHADPRRWVELMAEAMGADFSWGRSAGRYLALYRSIAEHRRPEPPDSADTP
jgi:starch synthase